MMMGRVDYYTTTTTFFLHTSFFIIIINMMIRVQYCMYTDGYTLNTFFFLQYTLTLHSTVRVHSLTLYTLQYDTNAPATRTL
jgi:hypothetical protein